MTVIRYVPEHSGKVQLATMRLIGLRRFGTQLGPIGSCYCCQLSYGAMCHRFMRRIRLIGALGEWREWSAACYGILPDHV